MTNEDKDKKEYELGLLLKSEEDTADIVKFVAQHGGEMLSEPRAKRLALAYEIKGNKEATFTYFNFRAFGDEVKSLEHDLNSRQDVIRSLLVIATPPNEPRSSFGAGPMPRRGGKPMRSAPPSEPSTQKSQSLSNEALEKKIEEILQ